MKKFKIIIFLLISFFVFLPKLNAFTVGEPEWQTDLSNRKYYSDTTIAELWSTSEQQRIFCIDHSIQHICEGAKYYKDSTVPEGPACAFTDFGWFTWGDQYNKSGTSKTSNYHNIIRYVQYYTNSTSSCQKYWYNSGYCTSNNKSAADDTNASIVLSKNSDFTIENDYYISEIKVTYSGSVTKYKVSSSNSDVLLVTSKDSNENVLNKEINNSILYIKVPKEEVTKEMKIDLNASGSYSRTCNYYKPALERYYSNYSNCQPISFLKREPGSDTQVFTKSASLSFNVSPITGKIKIIKIDATTNLPLADVKFKLYKTNGEIATYIDGKEVEELTTASNGEIIIDNLYRDTYILKETSNLPEYLKLTEDIKIILDSEYEEITVSNDPIIIKISKKDITTKNELSGAEMTLKDEEGNIVKEFISKEEPTSFYISPGTYTLIEMLSPSGYAKLETTFKFEVKEDGSINLISTDNKYFSLEEDVIILYNELEKIKVPDTAETLNYILLGFGFIILLGGSIFIYKATKTK